MRILTILAILFVLVSCRASNTDSVYPSGRKARQRVEKRQRQHERERRHYRHLTNATRG